MGGFSFDGGFVRNAAFLRLNSDGTLDGTFGTAGEKLVDQAGSSDNLFDLLLQDDGKIIGVGPEILRLNSADGSLDTTFDTDGKAPLISPVTTARGGALQSDGKIVVAGGTATSTIWGVMRLTAMGAADTSFGGTGAVTTTFGSTAAATSVVVQPDDQKIVVLGTPDFSLARYNTDGTPDTSFGTSGKTTITFGLLTEIPHKLLLQPDGKFIIIGQNSTSGAGCTLIRANADGTVDTTFGTAGLVTTQFASSGGSGEAFFGGTLQTDNKIVGVGGIVGSPTDVWNIGRYENTPPAPTPTPTPPAGADATLDPSFGTGGNVTTNLGGTDNEANALALQPDKKIVAAGFSNALGTNAFALARYNNDGSLDTTFGPGGSVVTAISANTDEAKAVIMRKDGRIVAAGFSGASGTEDFALARYTADGTLDTSFGTNGTRTTAISGGSDEILAAVHQSDGKIIAAGFSGTDFAVARYTENGSLDTTFGTGGTGFVTTDISGGTDQVLGVAVQPDGKIVAVGAGGTNFGLTRYTANGALDTSFGTNGIVTSSLSAGTDQANAVVIHPDGSIIVAGFSGNDFAVARYNSDGTLDSSFSTNGFVITAITTETDQANGVLLQPDGKIVAIGFGDDNFSLARYLTNGTLDKTFGVAGTISTAIGSSTDLAETAVVEPDGSILAAGFSNQGGIDEFALVRYLIPSIDVSPAAQAMRAKYALLQMP